jgi:DNA-binding Xre family transcriptional regulator
MEYLVKTIQNTTVTKMVKGEIFNMNVIVRIRNALDCTASDILAICPDGANKTG